jgi:hypothetical protein
MHGHVSQLDKCCPPECITGNLHEYRIPTHTRPNLLFFPRFSIPDDELLQLLRAQATATSIIMSSHSQSTSGPSSDVNSPPAPPITIFELNLARRDRVAGELETLRSGTLFICLIINVRNQI